MFFISISVRWHDSFYCTQQIASQSPLYLIVHLEGIGLPFSRRPGNLLALRLDHALQPDHQVAVSFDGGIPIERNPLQRGDAIYKSPNKVTGKLREELFIDPEAPENLMRGIALHKDSHVQQRSAILELEPITGHPSRWRLRPSRA